MLSTMVRLQQHPEFLADTPPPATEIEKAQGQTITLTETQNGLRKWVLKMQAIDYGHDNRMARLTSVVGLVYGDQGDPMFTFKAPSGWYWKENSRIRLEGGASLFSPTTRITLNAPVMDWSASGQSVTATGGVRMTKPDFGVTQAHEAILAMDFSRIQFSGKTTSVIGNDGP
jgi:hypothetical protein